MKIMFSVFTIVSAGGLIANLSNVAIKTVLNREINNIKTLTSLLLWGIIFVISLGMVISY